MTYVLRKCLIIFFCQVGTVHRAVSPLTHSSRTHATVTMAMVGAPVALVPVVVPLGALLAEAPDHEGC